MRFEWTKEATARLRELAASGMRSDDIAEKMGLTKGAICGRCLREGIMLLAKGGHPPRRHGVSPGAVVIPRDPHEPLPLEDRIGAGSAVAALTYKQCAWPVGDPTKDGFHFCSKRRAINISPPYCKEHLQVAANKKIQAAP